MLAITGMVTLWKFEVMSGKFNSVANCISGCNSHKWVIEL